MEAAMKFGLRRVAALAVVASFIVWLVPDAVAQYPNRPVRVIVPFPPGGSLDTLTRAISLRLQSQLGQPFTIENRPGASGNIGADAVVKAAPDGHTLLSSLAAIAINPHLQKSVPFDLTRDLAGISLFTAGPFVLVANPKAPFGTVQDLVEHARRNPGKIAYGTQGNGTVPHLAMEWMRNLAKIDLLHVPYKGSAPNVQALIAGETLVAFEPMVSTRAHVQAGRLKALAVTSREPSASLPGVPALAATYSEFEIEGWQGFFAPARTPMEIRNRLASELARAIQAPEIVKLLQDVGSAPRSSASPEAFDAFVRAEYEKWGRIVRENNIKSDQ
jgi:tripartite-type tricarboxylate transporter receptor subunit TctC